MDLQLLRFHLKHISLIEVAHSLEVEAGVEEIASLGVAEHGMELKAAIRRQVEFVAMVALLAPAVKTVFGCHAEVGLQKVDSGNVEKVESAEAFVSAAMKDQTEHDYVATDVRNLEYFAAVEHAAFEKGM